MAGPVAIGGTVAEGFQVVSEEFERNFVARGELGAAFAAYRGENLVVDLWGGWADDDRRQPWRSDTLQLVFSGSKGLVAACLLLLIERGQLDLSMPVSRYWPEFAACGKRTITVREVATHTARLPGLTTPVTDDEILDHARVSHLLAQQEPLRDLRASRTYHALTYGWLCGELVKRTDGRSIGRFFADEFARPLDLEVYIGLPAGLEDRVSRIELADGWGRNSVLGAAPHTRDELVQAVWGNPCIWLSERFPWNDRKYHEAEIPGANAIGTARDVAKFYASLGSILSPEVLTLGRKELERRDEPLLGEQQAYGVGFQLQTARRALGPPSDAFGHTGAGGSAHGAWPSLDVGFSYAMNLLRDDDPAGDPRARALLSALHDAVEGGLSG